MTTNFKNIIVYGLAIYLAIILAVAISGCKTSAPAVPSASTGSPTAATPTATRPRQGVSSTPTMTIPPVSSPAAVSSPSATPPPASSSLISTSIPVPTSILPVTSIGGSPIILITAPLNVSIIPAGDVTISTLVSGFNLVDKIGQASIASEGHIIYYMDVTPPIIPNQVATTDMGTCAESAAISYTWHNVGAGFHYFSVQLVNNDDTPLSPPVVLTIYVTVQGATQSSPSPSSTMTTTPTS